MWLESHANLARHPKTRRLMKLLGWSLPDTIGNLHLFWWWALDFAPTGDLTRYTPEELTADLDLGNATPKEFIEAMIQAGFIDRSASATAESHSGGNATPDQFGSGSAESRHGGNTLRIHDWPEYMRPKPRKKALPRLSSDRAPALAGERNPNLAVPPRRDPEHDAPTCAMREPQLVGSALRADPNIHQPDSSTPLPASSFRPVQTGNDPQLVVPPGADEPLQVPNTNSCLDTQRAALNRLNTVPHKLRSSATGELSSERLAPIAPTVETANTEEVQNELTARLRQLPGFAKYWWPLYLDFHKKAGTPLDKNQRAKILERFNKAPLTAIEQIKAGITKAVRSDTEWTGVLEHAP